MKPTLDRSAAPLLRVTFYPTITKAEVRAHFQEMRDAVKELGRAAVVVDLSSPPPFLNSLALVAGEEMRATFRQGAHLVGAAHVTPSAAARAMLAAVQWLAPPPFPTLVTGSDEEASSWAFARLARKASAAERSVAHRDARTVAGLARALLAGARALGNPIESRELSAVGISGSELSAPEGYLAYDALSQLSELIAGRREDPNLGLRAGSEFVDSASLGLVGIAARSSKNLEDAFARVARHARLIDENIALSLSSDASGLRVTVNPAAPLEWPPQFAELLLSALLASSREWSGVHFAVNGVGFRHAAPACADPYARAFGCVPVFEARENFLIVPSQMLVQPLPHGDAQQARYFDMRLEELARVRSSAPGPLQDVRAATLSLLSQGTPTVASVGGRLGLSGRTLQRRLNERGVTFADILDSVRREAALNALARPSASIQESAESCGFTDVKAFRRAFLRWTGQSPSVYRKTHH